jgi:hypothetical protein
MRTGREFEMPAQLTKILIGPSSFSTSAMAAFTTLLSVPSTCHPLAGAPAFSFLTSSIVSAVSRKSKAATVAPVFAKARQIPCPIPLAEPTIRTVQGVVRSYRGRGRHRLCWRSWQDQPLDRFLGGELEVRPCRRERWRRT